MVVAKFCFLACSRSQIASRAFSACTLPLFVNCDVFVWRVLRRASVSLFISTHNSAHLFEWREFLGFWDNTIYEHKHVISIQEKRIGCHQVVSRLSHSRPSHSSYYLLGLLCTTGYTWEDWRPLTSSSYLLIFEFHCSTFDSGWWMITK